MMSKEEFLDKIQNFAQCTCEGWPAFVYSERNRKWSHYPTAETVDSRRQHPVTPGEPSGNSETQTQPRHPLLFKRSHFLLTFLSVGVMVLQTSVSWCHQWLFIVYVGQLWQCIILKHIFTMLTLTCAKRYLEKKKPICSMLLFISEWKWSSAFDLTSSSGKDGSCISELLFDADPDLFWELACWNAKCSV